MVKGKYLNFIKSNIRYSKYQIIVVAILFILAAALINVFLFLSLNYNSNYDVERTRLNGEDIDLLFVDNELGNSKVDKIGEILSGLSNVKDYEVNPVVTNSGTAEYKGGKISQNLTYMSLSEAQNKEIGKYELLEDSGESGVYLGYIFSVDSGYKIGDEITITLGMREDTFKVAGFYNNVDTGSINCTDIVFLLTDDCYEKVAKESADGYRISVLVNEPDSADKQEAKVSQSIRNGVPTLMPLRSSNAIRLAASRYVTSTLFQAIISLTSILIIAVLLVIIVVSLSNYIRNNMKNLGTLKAMGYLSKDLIVPIVAEFFVISLISSIIGVAVSYLIMPILNTALECQVGIPYQIHFMLKEALVSVAICVLAATVTTFVSVVRIRKIAPILAIRDSATKKRARKNFFPLDRTKFGLNTALSLKTWIAAKSRNIVVFLSITGVAFLLGFSCFIYQNIVIDSDHVMTLIYGNISDSTLTVLAENEDALKDKLNENKDIEDYYMYTIGNINPDGLPKLYSYTFDEEEYVNSALMTGNLPKTADEIAINGAYAKRNGLKIGDALKFENQTMKICGLTQGAASSGNDCYLTRDGYAKIQPMNMVTYYVNLKDGKGIDDFNKEMATQISLMNYSNFREASDIISSSYMSVLSLATIIVVIVSLIITGFILYILVSLQLANMKRDHGILKSLGFVTKDIIYQTVVSILPTCIMAVIVGLLLSRNGASMILIMAVRSLGIFKFGTPTSYALLGIAGLGITVFSTLYSIILSGSVRFITPHQLFNKE